jgi:hypothetical protein
MSALTNMTATAESHVDVRIKGRWVAVPALDVNGKKIIVKGKWLKSATVRSEDMMEKELENPELYVDRLRREKKPALKADIFTFAQKIPNTEPKHAYLAERESIAAVHLVTFKEWWEGLPQETRKNVRRAQKRGLQVRISEFDDHLIQGIRGVNDETPLRQGVANAYYGRTPAETKRLYGEFLGRCDFICAYFGDELVGFLHLVYRDDVASILNLTVRPSHFDKRPSNALMAKAAEICEAKGISYITYGRYNYGNKQDSPLREFKIRNGFKEIFVPRFYVPLNAWGAFCLKANLHRGLVGILPHSVIAAGIKVRTKWYSFKHPRSRCSSTPERPNRTRQMERSIPPAGSNPTPPIADR